MSNRGNGQRPRWPGKRCQKTGRPIIPNFERETGGQPATDENVATYLEENGYRVERWRRETRH